MARVLCVGVTTQDLIFRVDGIPTTPSKVLAKNLVESSGGMAANAAIAIARLGGAVSLWSRVGADDKGDWLLGELAKNNVDVSNVRQLEECQSSVSAILINEKGEKLVCPYYDNSLDDDASWLPLDRLSDFDIILLDPRWPAAVEAVTREAQLLGIKTVLDADTGDIALLRNLLPLASHTIFSLPALQAITGNDGIETSLKCMWHLTKTGVGSTAGRNGFYWYEDGKLLHVAPSKRNVKPALDTLAAGDVFHGAICLALAEGLSMPLAAEFAVTAATLKCSTFGGIQGAPVRKQVDAVLAEARSIEPSN